MNTGITIEQLIATVARVEAKVERKQREDAGVLSFPLPPFQEDVNLIAQPGVA
jgi:hypothetical protein